MANKEINLVLEMVEKGAAAMEKATHVLWSRDDLLEAQANHQFKNDDRISKPMGNDAVTSLYPGCLNMMGKLTGRGNNEPIAQTSHFLIFGSPSESTEVPSRCETSVEAAELS